MSLLPDVVRLQDWPAAAWLASSAYVHRRWRSRVIALLAWPVYLLTLMPAVLLGGAYWRGRDGLVLVHRWRPVVDSAVLAATMLVGLLAGLLAAVWWPGFAVVLALLVLWFDAGLVVVVILGGLGSAVGVAGRGTPPGPRWFIGGLAQRPGTRLTAALLARDLIAQLPAGAVLLAVAADQQLRDRYLRLGFTEGTKRRVFRVIP